MVNVVQTKVPDGVNVREYYLNCSENSAVPVIGYSSVLSERLVRHIMTSKKTAAVAEKYVSGDMITNMEGALHTLIVPVIFPVYLHGFHYHRDGQHGMDPTPLEKFTSEPYTAAVKVVLSALVQSDFENEEVMLQLIKLDPFSTTYGTKFSVTLDETIPSPEVKKNPDSRIAYDTNLKKHMIYHFATDRQLPAAKDVRAITELEATDQLRNSTDKAIFINVSNTTICLEMLEKILREQLRVELATIRSLTTEPLCYTWDPPAIFAKVLSADLLDELWLRNFSVQNLEQFRVILFNDYRNKTIIPRLQKALSSRYPGLTVCSKADMQDFMWQELTLVVHNNGDAFGLHILTQPISSSLDGAYGSMSSAAASFMNGIYQYKPID